MLFFFFSRIFFVLFFSFFFVFFFPLRRTTLWKNRAFSLCVSTLVVVEECRLVSSRRTTGGRLSFFLSFFLRLAEEAGEKAGEHLSCLHLRLSLSIFYLSI